jgi:hypothetical protein
MTNHVIQSLEGGRARTRSAFFDLDMETGLLFGSGFYTVDHLRTADGWRITSLVLEQRLADNALQRILDQRAAAPRSTPHSTPRDL